MFLGLVVLVVFVIFLGLVVFEIFLGLVVVVFCDVPGFGGCGVLFCWFHGIFGFGEFRGFGGFL